MGYYEDHIRAVAKRRASLLILNGEKKERKALKKMGWNDAEIDMIIALERKHEEDGQRWLDELDELEDMEECDF